MGWRQTPFDSADTAAHYISSTLQAWNSIRTCRYLGDHLRLPRSEVERRRSADINTFWLPDEGTFQHTQRKPSAISELPVFPSSQMTLRLLTDLPPYVTQNDVSQSCCHTRGPAEAHTLKPWGRWHQQMNSRFCSLIHAAHFFTFTSASSLRSAAHSSSMWGCCPAGPEAEGGTINTEGTEVSRHDGMESCKN